MTDYKHRKYNEDGLNMPLKELRDSINLNKKIWKHILSTNCYAYALGLDLKQNNIKQYAYIPGTISNSNRFLASSKQFQYSTLLQNLYNDLEFLGIDFREIDPDEEISKDEWKISFFTSFWAYEFYQEWLQDFHFLRQHENGIWYHKSGWYKPPNNRDSNFKIITDPRCCHIKGRQYRKCYSLKLR